MLLFAGLPVPAQPPTAQPEMTTLKSSFVPGDKTIFYDDFTDMSAGDAPPHFKVRGAAPELQAAGDVRQLTISQRGSIFPNITALPKNFTYEAEIKFDPKGRAIAHLILLSGTKQVLVYSTTASPNQCDLQVQLKVPAYQDLGRKRIQMSWAEPAKLALWVQNGRLRIFVNGEKHLDFNQVEMPAITGVSSPTTSMARISPWVIARFASPNPRRTSARSSRPPGASLPTASCSIPRATA
jgi:hypothetical protein